MKYIIAVALGGAVLAAMAILQNPSRAQTTTTSPASAVKSITLPTMPVELPPGPGREVAGTACVLCHTARYILMQPAFPEKTWAAEVDKMRTNYGAPLTDEQAASAVKYLMSIRGAPTPATK